MSNNPYSSPNFSGGYSPPASAGDPLRAPATAILIVGILFEVLLAFSVVAEIVMIASGMADQMENRNPLVANKQQELMVRMVIAIFLMALHAFVIYGAVSMMRYRNYGAAYAAAIISVIPCCSGCYLIGIPFGIWALSVLNRPEVKARFR